MFPLLSPEHRGALTDPQTWVDNPFVRREMGRDRKKQQPTRSFAWMCGTLLILGGAGLWGLSLLATHGFGNTWVSGGDLGVTLCILICGIHIYYVVGATQKHTLRLIADEISKNTFPCLMLLPASRFELVLQAMVYPWCVGMRAALVLLPLYALCVGLGGVSWLDVVMLYVVFALSAVSVPRWSRPALHEDIATSIPTAEVPPWMVRSGAGGSTPQSANQNSSFGQWASMACLFLLFGSIFNSARLSGIHTFIHRYAPESIFVLLPNSIFSWPLLVARGLITPFDWYGLPIPPLPFVLFFFFFNRYTQLVRVSEWLQVGRYRDLVALSTYLPRRRLEGKLIFGQAYVGIGYIWAWAVRDGGLTLVAGQAGEQKASGLIGLAYLFVLASVYFSGMARAGNLAGWHRARWENRERQAVPSLTAASAARYLAAPLLIGVALYLCCCVTAGVNPAPAGLMPLAGKMLLVGAAGMLLRYGALRLSSLGILLGLAVPPLVIGLYQSQAQIHVPLKLIYQLAYFSPLMGMVNLGNPTLLGMFGIGVSGLLSPPLPWHHWLLYSGVGGGLLLIPALLENWLRRMPPKKGDLDPAARLDMAVIDPTLTGTEVFSDSPVAQKREADRTDSPAALLLIDIVQRVTDNGIAIREMRVRLRGKLMPVNLQRILFVLVAVALALYYLIPVVPETLGMGIARGMLNHTDVGTARACGILLIGYLVVILIAPFSGIGIFPYVFAVEQEKSTLGFTLTTPMRTSALAAGKAFGLLLVHGIALTGMLLWMLLLTLIFLPWVGVTYGLGVWGGVALSALMIHITLGLIALATASLFPGRLSAKVSGVMRVILIYVVIFGSQGLGWLLRWISVSLGIGPLELWLLSLSLGAVISVVCIVISIWAIERLRHKDFFEASTKRSN